VATPALLKCETGRSRRRSCTMLKAILAGAGFALALTAFNSTPASAFGWCWPGYGAHYAPSALYRPRVGPRVRFYRRAYYRPFRARAYYRPGFRAYRRAFYRPGFARGYYRSGLRVRGPRARAFYRPGVRASLRPGARATFRPGARGSFRPGARMGRRP
jgi:hypothetical protein